MLIEIKLQFIENRKLEFFKEKSFFVVSFEMVNFYHFFFQYFRILDNLLIFYIVLQYFEKLKSNHWFY